MLGLNVAFRSSPDKFITQWLIDNSFYTGTQLHGTEVSKTLLAFDRVKQGKFDLRQNPHKGLLDFHPLAPKEFPISDELLRGYWVPYHSGPVEPGWVDIQLTNPPLEFVLRRDKMVAT